MKTAEEILKQYYRTPIDVSANKNIERVEYFYHEEDVYKAMEEIAQQAQPDKEMTTGETFFNLTGTGLINETETKNCTYDELVRNTEEDQIMSLKIVTFFNKKAKEQKYDDFNHWLDCCAYEKMELTLIEWIIELIKSLALRQRKIIAKQEELIEVLNFWFDTDDIADKSQVRRLEQELQILKSK
jgi:hypothetical protein